MEMCQFGAISNVPSFCVKGVFPILVLLFMVSKVTSEYENLKKIVQSIRFKNPDVHTLLIQTRLNQIVVNEPCLGNVFGYTISVSSTFQTLCFYVVYYFVTSFVLRNDINL